MRTVQSSLSIGVTARALRTPWDFAGSAGAPGTSCAGRRLSRGSSGCSLKLPSEGLLARPAAGGGDCLHLVDEAGPIDIGLDRIADAAGRLFKLRLREQPVQRRGNFHF